MSKSSSTDIAKLVLDSTLPGSSALVDLLVKATGQKITDAEEASKGSLAKLREEATKQDVELKLAEGQARVAQELAIAARIQDAHEVEMEEYYEYAGEGHVGGKAEDGTISIGIGGSGKRVSKRVFRFKGAQSNSNE